MNSELDSLLTSSQTSTSNFYRPRRFSSRRIFFLCTCSTLAYMLALNVASTEHVKFLNVHIRFEASSTDCNSCSFLTWCSLKTIVYMIFKGIHITDDKTAGFLRLPSGWLGNILQILIYLLVKLWQVAVSLFASPILFIGLLDEAVLFFIMLLNIFIINIVTFISVGEAPDNYIWHPVLTCFRQVLSP